MFEAVEIDRTLAMPLYRQVYTAFRGMILSGDLAPHSRLPSTRAVAQELSVSRNTVIAAFDQLGAEGFVDLKVGVGIQVCDVGQQAQPSSRETATCAPEGSRLGQRGQLLARPLRQAPSDQHEAFPAGVPDTSVFPRTTWSRLLSRHSKMREPSLAGYAHAGGYPALRESIAAYLRTSRGVRCTPGQVIVMSSAQAGLDLSVRLLTDHGDSAIVEDPGYPSARAAIEGAGLTVLPVRVDDEGLDIDRVRNSDSAKLVCVTPSHQYPTGVTMPLPRRLALLDWATRNSSWIIEDDYDSEFHYDVRPIPSLQGLADTRQVIYMGTFAKTLVPGLRIAYIVVPEDLGDDFTQAIRHTGQEPPLLIQAALADFINEGHFARHLRRMRRLYAGRRTLLVEALGRHCADRLCVISGQGGLQLAVRLTRSDDDDVELAARAHAAGLSVLPLSSFCATGAPVSGLILGFAATPDEVIEDSVMRLAHALRA